MMTASRQDPGPETPVGRPGATTTTGPGPAATGGTPITPSPAHASSMGGGAVPSHSSGEDVAGRAKADAEAAASQTKAAADDMAAGVRDKSEDLKDRARGAVDEARQRARSVAGEQKNLAAERLSGFADALRHASSDLDEQGQTLVSGFVRQAAEGLDNCSGAMRRNDVDDLVGGIEDFARRQPAVFIGSAVLAGFGIARFMKSSSERRHARRADYAGAGFEDPGPRYGAGRSTNYGGGV